MNTFERRVSEALRGYGEGLEMTTHDVNRLEDELEQKRASKRGASKDRRRTVFQWAVAACAVTGVVLGVLALRSGPDTGALPVGPPSQAVSPSPMAFSEVAGIWREEPRAGDDPSGWLWTFSTRGLAIDSGPDSVFDPEPTHRLGLEADGFTITDTEAPDCTTRFSTVISAEGRMRATVTTSTPVQGRMCDLKKGDAISLTRVSPVTPAGLALTSLWPARGQRPVTVAGDLRGTWLQLGTGKVLAITGAGGYEIQDVGDASVRRTGTVTVPRAGRIVVTAADDPTCTATYDPTTTTYNGFAAGLRQGTCASWGRAGDQWVRLN